MIISNVFVDAVPVLNPITGVQLGCSFETRVFKIPGCHIGIHDKGRHIIAYLVIGPCHTDGHSYTRTAKGRCKARGSRDRHDARCVCRIKDHAASFDDCQLIIFRIWRRFIIYECLDISSNRIHSNSARARDRNPGSAARNRCRTCHYQRVYGLIRNSRLGHVPDRVNTCIKNIGLHLRR